MIFKGIQKSSSRLNKTEKLFQSGITSQINIQKLLNYLQNKTILELISKRYENVFGTISSCMIMYQTVLEQSCHK